MREKTAVLMILCLSITLAYSDSGITLPCYNTDYDYLLYYFAVNGKIISIPGRLLEGLHTKFSDSIITSY